MTDNIAAHLAEGSPLSALHSLARPGTPLRRALDGIPDWKAAADHLAKLGPRRRPDVSDAGARQAVDLLVSEALAAGEDLHSEELAERAATTYTMGLGKSLIASGLENLRADHSGALELAFTQNVAAVFRHLNKELGDLLAEARTIDAKLSGISTLEAAVDAGLVNEFRGLRALGGRHSTLRSAQRAVFQAVDSQGRQMSRLPAAHIADPIAVDPDFIARTNRARVLIRGDETREARPAPWPEDWTSYGTFVWLVRNPDAKPWIPTMRELDDAMAALDAEALAARSEMTERRSSAVHHDRSAYRNRLLAAGGTFV